jgi:hypothetical protein
MPERISFALQMQETPSYSETRQRIVEEKTNSVMRWLFSQIDADAVETDPMQVLQPGVLAPNISALYEYFLREEHPTDGIRVLRLETIHSLLHKSVQSCFDYLVTPHQFLTTFLLEGVDLKKRLRTLVDQEFYPVLIEEFLKQNDRTSLGSDELRSLLKSIDEVIFHFATVSVMVDILEPVFTFVHYRHGEPYIEKEVLVEFFHHHDLTRCVERISLSDAKVFTLRELVALMSDELLASVPSEPPPNVNVSVNDFTAREIPAYNEFIGSLKDTGIHLQVKDVPAVPHYLPLSYFIPKDVKEQIIKKVFRHSEAAYHDLIRSLETAASKESAIGRLNAILRMHGQNDRSKLSQKLAEAITLRYHTQY